MAKKKRQSALILTQSAWEILQKYRNAYGVKNTLSVGLELFDGLSRDAQFEKVTASEAADTVVRRAEADALERHKTRRHNHSRATG